jgi:hypothetical protein
MATNENQRQAAVIWVGISNYVGTAALAVLAAVLALFTYLSQNYDVGALFYCFMALSAGLLVVSLAVGGSVADEVAASVSKGSFPKSEWNDQAPSGFSAQSMLTFLGLLALLVAVGVGATSHRQTSDTQKQLSELTRRMGGLEQTLKTSEAQNAARIRALARRLAKASSSTCSGRRALGWKQSRPHETLPGRAPSSYWTVPPRWRAAGGHRC